MGKVWHAKLFLAKCYSMKSLQELSFSEWTNWQLFYLQNGNWCCHGNRIFFFLSLHIWVCPSTEISLRTISKKDERQGGLLEGAWELFTSTSDNGHLWTNHLSFSSWSRWKIKKSTFHPHLLMAAIYFFIWCLILIKLHKNGPLSKGNRDSSVYFHQQVNCHNL